MTKFGVRLLAVFVVLSFIAIPVFAKRGGVQVSGTSGDGASCADSSHENNHINSCTVRVWVNLASPNAASPTTTWDWTLNDKGKPICGPTDFGDSWVPCDDGFWYNDVSICTAVSGSVTLEVDNANGESVGSDSFLINCD